jgi:DNA repair exonuclease SbcCD ATPase subunit
MRLKTLTLTNFKRHRDLHLDFHHGSNAIMGPNYAGKSTILEAILVLLWGNKGASVPADQLHSDESKGFELTGVFSNDWVIKRTSRDSSITRAGETFVRGHTSVNAAVEEYLGMDRNTFMRVFASKQGSPQQILEMEGMELQRFIESCIQLDTLDAMVKEANKRGIVAKAAIQAFEGLLKTSEEFEVIQKELRGYKVQLEAVAANMALGDQRMLDLQFERDMLQKDLSMAVQHNKAVDTYERAVAAVLHHGDAREPILECQRNTEAMIANLNGLDRDWYVYKQACLALSRLQQDLDKLGNSAPVKPEPLKDLSFLEADAEMLSDAIKEKSVAIRDLKDLVHNAKCPTCKRSYELTEEQIEQKAAELLITEGEYSKLSKRHAESKQLWQEANQHNALQVKRERMWELYDQQLETAKARLAEATVPEQPTVAESELPALMEKAKEELKGIMSRNGEREVAWRMYLSDKAKLDALENPGPGIPYDHIHSKLQEVTAEADQVTRAYQDDLRTLGTLKTTIAKHEDVIKHHTQAEATVQEKSEYFQKLKNISTVLSDNRSKIVSDAMTVVLGAASDFVRTCTDGDISEVLLHEGSLAYREGDRIRFKGSASGAQKTLMGVGMKLGLARLIRTPFEGLLLDEVSADMDDEISMRCMLALSSFGQSIFVSHRQMDVADQVINLER